MVKLVKISTYTVSKMYALYYTAMSVSKEGRGRAGTEVGCG